MNDGTATFFTGVVIGITLTTIVASVGKASYPLRVTECRAEPEWCRVEKPELHEAIFGELP